MRHAANIKTSERLQKVLSVLQDGCWHSTLDIMLKTSLCAVGSAVSELRVNGIDVESQCKGHGKYEYKLKDGDAMKRSQIGGQTASLGEVCETPVSPIAISGRRNYESFITYTEK